MIRPALLLAAALLPAVLPAPIRFTLLRDRDDSLQLTMRQDSVGSHHIITRTTRVGDLAGLDSALLSGNRAADLHFGIRREAGTLDCRGAAARGQASGACNLTPDLAFADALARRGIARPTPGQTFLLASQGVRVVLIDELKRQGYSMPSLDQLIACGIHDVDPGFVRAIATAGYRPGSIEKLIAFRIHGVTPAWIGALTAADSSLAHASGDELVTLRINGLDPDWLREMVALGYRGLAPSKLAVLRIHDITPDFARRMGEAEGGRPSPERLVELRILGPMAHSR